MSETLERHTFQVGPLGCNCSILWSTKNQQAIIIDPGAEFEKIQKVCRQHKLDIVAILHTHAHFDHIGASEACHHEWGSPVYLESSDLFLWNQIEMQGAAFGLSLDPINIKPERLEDEMAFTFGSFQIKTLHTPGHTPGSCSFLVNDLLFAGDTLFLNSVGRSDLWGGDFAQLSKSIKERLYCLDDDTEVIAGHGPNTRIGREKRNNPFVSV